ncbi:MAG: hypothetical protein WC551_07550 [Patescibacteria group bacterium]
MTNSRDTNGPLDANASEDMAQANLAWGDALASAHALWLKWRNRALMAEAQCKILAPWRDRSLSAEARCQALEAAISAAGLETVEWENHTMGLVNRGESKDWANFRSALNDLTTRHLNTFRVEMDHLVDAYSKHAARKQDETEVEKLHGYVKAAIAAKRGTP